MNLKKSTGRTSSVSNAARINPKSSEIDIETWPLSKNPITEEDKTQGMLADRVLNDYMVSILPSAGKEDYNKELLRNDLEFLNRKLETIRKTVTAWDVYNILGVAEKAEDINQLLNTLAPNSSFIVNTKQTYVEDKNKKEYSVGDIVFKDIAGNNHIIKAQGAGVYYPQSLIKQAGSNTYELTYTFSNIIPSETNTPTAIRQDPTADLPGIGYSMKATLDITNEDQPYGKRGILNNTNNIFRFEIQNKIQPVIYIYLIDEQGHHERIWLDDSCYKYIDDTTKLPTDEQNIENAVVSQLKKPYIKITKPESIPTLYIEVR